MKTILGCRFVITSAALTAFNAHAGGLDVASPHSSLIESVKHRGWDAVKSVLAEDSVFHRASGDQLFIAPDVIVERPFSTIGTLGYSKWNSRSSKPAGKDCRVAERGDIALTAGSQ